MGKSKAQRKQEKKAFMQEVKEIKKAEDSVKDVKEQKEERVEKSQPSKLVNQPEQINLTMYTLVYMVVTFLSTGLAAFAMAMYGNPAKYLIKSYVGEGLDEFSREMLRLYLIDDLGEGKMNGLYLGVGIILIIGALAMLVGMIGAVNDKNEPIVALNVIGVITAIAALVLYLYADNYIKDGIIKYEIDRMPEFGAYSLYLPFLIANIVLMIINTISSINGLNRWKKTGKTSK